MLRTQAYQILRHYPSDWNLSILSDSCPHVLDSGESLDPLYKMVRTWDQTVGNTDCTATDTSGSTVNDTAATDSAATAQHAYTGIEDPFGTNAAETTAAAPVRQRVWVDPPAGWRWGFPKLWDPNVEPDCVEWMVSEGYPRAEITKMGDYFYCRQWAEDPTV